MLKMVWGVLKAAVLSFTQADFNGWLSNFPLLFLNGLMQLDQLRVCLHELLTPLLSFLGSSHGRGRRPAILSAAPAKKKKKTAETITPGG